jgi:hypothetical protein
VCGAIHIQVFFIKIGARWAPFSSLVGWLLLLPPRPLGFGLRNTSANRNVVPRHLTVKRVCKAPPKKVLALAIDHALAMSRHNAFECEHERTFLLLLPDYII